MNETAGAILTRRPSDYRRAKHTAEPREEFVDWRSAEQQKADAQLVGTWFRCRVHGVLESTGVVLVGDVTYCGEGECGERVLLAHSAMSDRAPENDWTRAENRTVLRPPKRRRDPEPEVQDNEEAPVPEKSPPSVKRSVRDIVLEFLEEEGISPRSRIVDAVSEERPRDDGRPQAGPVGRTLGALVREELVVCVGEDLYRLDPDPFLEQDDDEEPLDEEAEDQGEDDEGTSDPEESIDETCAGTSGDEPASATSSDAAPKVEHSDHPDRAEALAASPAAPSAQNRPEERGTSRTPDVSDVLKPYWICVAHGLVREVDSDECCVEPRSTVTPTPCGLRCFGDAWTNPQGPRPMTVSLARRALRELVAAIHEDAGGKAGVGTSTSRAEPLALHRRSDGPPVALHVSIAGEGVLDLQISKRAARLDRQNIVQLVSRALEEVLIT